MTKPRFHVGQEVTITHPNQRYATNRNGVVVKVGRTLVYVKQEGTPGWRKPITFRMDGGYENIEFAGRRVMAQEDFQREALQRELTDRLHSAGLEIKAGHYAKRDDLEWLRAVVEAAEATRAPEATR